MTVNVKINSVLLGPLLIAILGVTAVASPSWGTQLFYWNADQLNTTSLGSIGSVGPRTSIDTADKVQGTGSMKLTVPSPDESQMGIEPGGNPIGNSVNGQWLYNRWWMKIDAAFDW